MAIPTSPLQSAQNGTTGTGTVTVTLGATPTAGNVLIAVASARGGPAVATPSGWTLLEEEPGNGGTWIFGRAASGAGTTHVFTAASGTGNIAASVGEWVGLDTDMTSIVHRSGTATASAATSLAVALSADTTTPTLLFAGVGFNGAPGTVTWSNSFGALTAATAGSGNGQVYAGSAHRVGSSSSGYSTTIGWTTSRIAFGVMVALREAPGGSAYSATIAATLPGLSASATATHVAPTFSASIAGTLPGLTASVEATFAAPGYVASIAATLPALSASATATHVAPTFAATVTGTLPGLTATAEASFAAPGNVASIAATLPALSGTATATHVGPTYSATVAASLPALTATVAASFAMPGHVASIAGTLPALTATMAATFEPAPEFTATITGTLAALSATMTVTLGAPPIRALQMLEMETTLARRIEATTTLARRLELTTTV
jgi:hypothetical protein